MGTTFRGLAQKETNVWNFGNRSGLNFNTSPPTQLFDSQINTVEGSASISDKNGNLLFYTDGATVYNRYHQVMASGLYGSYTSTQSALIILKPGSSSIYYIFTTDQGGYSSSNPNGLNYSEVNMCLGNGLGGIEQGKKNIPLSKPATEKLSAVLHKNGTDVWVLVHGLGDEFNAFLVTGDGVNNTPVKSNCGFYQKDYQPPEAVYWSTRYSFTIGQMKFSPQGDKIALGILPGGHVEIFDFDNTTGKVSNAQTLLHQKPKQGESLVYGIEFSPDGNQLYACNNISVKQSIFQRSKIDTLYQQIIKYNLKAGGTKEIIQSASLLENRILSKPIVNNVEEMASLQLAPDGKIYCQRATYDSVLDTLGIINNPNAIDFNEVGYQHTGIIIYKVIPPVNSYLYPHYGLPGFLASYFNPAPSIAYQVKCDKGIADFSIYNEKNIAKIHWDFGDSSGNNNESDSLNPTHTYLKNGAFEVSALVSLNDQSVLTLSKRIYINTLMDNFLGNDTTLCQQQFLNLDLTQLGGAYTWQDGSTNTIYKVSKDGLYWVDVCKGECHKRDSIRVIFKNYPLMKIDLGPDKVICDEKPVLLNASVPDGKYLWQDGSTQNTFLAFKTGKYYVESKNECGRVVDTINLTFQKIPEIHFSEDTLVCFGTPPSYDLTYLEKAGYVLKSKELLHSTVLNIPSSGTYSVEVSTKDCKYTYNFKVLFTECPEKMMVPNVFTPNHDPENLNETFELVGFEKRKWALYIYNRLGKEVYKNEAYANEWKGDGLVNGIYYYYLKDSKSDKSFKGWVEILR